MKTIKTAIKDTLAILMFNGPSLIFIAFLFFAVLREQDIRHEDDILIHDRLLANDLQLVNSINRHWWKSYRMLPLEWSGPGVRWMPPELHVASCDVWQNQKCTADMGD